MRKSLINENSNQRFARAERLRKRSEIDRVFTYGKTLSCRGMKLRYIENSRGYNRLVVVPERKLRNAVRRNAAKRVARELFRTAKPRFCGGYDCALIMFAGTYSFDDRHRQFSYLSRKAGL